MSLSLEELKEQIAALGEPAFRAGQIYDWLHAKQVGDFAQMSNISHKLQAELCSKFYIPCIKIKKKLVSSLDGTVKYLYELEDGECVESVLMRYKHGNTVCISTQAGCRMGCRFCASTLAGLKRNLRPSEMLGQVTGTARDIGERVSNIVLMGIGEPLDNFENVLRFLELVSHKTGPNIGLRHISLSTCGLVDKIDALAQKKLQLTLSVSLHAPNDEIRRQTMPVSRKWSIQELIRSCRDYANSTGRRISFEYALINGVNDSDANAAELASLLSGLLCHVNLIPVNEVKERGYTRTGQKQVERFQSILERRGIPTTVRRRLGADINAACGQLRRENASAT